MYIFGRVRWMHLSGVSYSLADPMVWELPLTMVSIGAHWIWTGVEREKLVFDFGNIWVDVFDTYMSMVIGSPCPCKHLMLLLCGDPRNFSRRYRGGGTAKRGDYHEVVWRCSKPDSAFCVRKYAIPLGGTAAGPRRDRKTWEFPRFQVAGGTGSAVGGTTLLVNL